MKTFCPKCRRNPFRTKNIIRAGVFRRKSDSKLVQRFYCKRCLTGFSRATHHPCVNQKKRKINDRVRRHLASGESMRRFAILFHINRKTVARKMLFMAKQAEISLTRELKKAKPAKFVEFDDLETFEHTKCKPVSVTLMVESKTRRILGFNVASMPCRGPLAKRAVKKYGFRQDERKEARRELFAQVRPHLHAELNIKSDMNPHYLPDVREFFPNANYVQYKGQRGSTTGQGELKRVRFDPIFSLNHTCAMLRANISRLIRKTWCTTKKRDRLFAHIALYVQFHNQTLLKLKTTG